MFTNVRYALLYKTLNSHITTNFTGYKMMNTNTQHSFEDSNVKDTY